MNLVHARRCAGLSNLVYQEPTACRKLIPVTFGVPANEVRFTWFEGEKSSTQGFGLLAGTDLYVAFRGTERTEVVDWVTDARIKPYEARNSKSEFQRRFAGGHSGFVEAYLTVAKQVRDFVTDAFDASGEPLRVWITGHSLGGALAVLAAHDLDQEFDARFSDGRVRLGGVYTFGQPAVARFAFARRIGKRVTQALVRLIHGDDPVPHLPPNVELPKRAKVSDWVTGHAFIHVGEDYFFDAAGMLWAERRLDPHIGSYLELAKEALEVSFFGPIHLAIKAGRQILDHGMDRYELGLAEVQKRRAALALGTDVADEELPS